MEEWGQSKELRIMSSHVHIALYDALREAAASEEKARAAAGAIPAGEHLATKQDIAELKVSFYRQLWIMAAGNVIVPRTCTEVEDRNIEPATGLLANSSTPRLNAQ